MKRMTTTVTYKVPNGTFCNHTMHKSTPLTRCRFCTDLGKNVFTCVLYNEPLKVIEGALIYKSADCLNKVGIVEEAVSINSKELIKYSVTQYRKLYVLFMDQGLPEPLAHKTAYEEVVK